MPTRPRAFQKKQQMRIQNHPSAYGLLAGLLVLLLGMIANVSCAHAAPAPDEAAQPTRTPAQRAETAVEIYTECGSGSGVLVDGRHVFTAYHVVNCATWPKDAPADAIVVRTLDRHSFVATIAVGDGPRDLARLRLAGEVEGVPPARIRKAKPDEIVCAWTAIPERNTRCGIVSSVDGEAGADVSVRGSNYWFGNSGSGVYGEDGALVAITTRLQWCSTGDAWLHALTDMRLDTCGGNVSTIEGRVR